VRSSCVSIKNKFQFCLQDCCLLRSPFFQDGIVLCGGKQMGKITQEGLSESVRAQGKALNGKAKEREWNFLICLVLFESLALPFSPPCDPICETFSRPMRLLCACNLHVSCRQTMKNSTRTRLKGSSVLACSCKHSRATRERKSMKNVFTTLIHFRSF
jgi:hypothetical protein